MRAEPSNTEVYALAEARLSKLEAWTKVVEDIRISSGDIKNFPYFSRLSTHRRFPVFLRFNTPLPLAPEHFVPFPDLIYLKFKNRPTSMFFRLGRTNFPNGRSFSHLLSLRLFLTRVADAFKIKSLPNPDAVMAQKCPPAAAALSTIQYMFDFTRPVHDSPLGAHFELVGREVVQCTAHKFEFVFRILAIYSELLDFFSYRVGNEGIPVAEMQRAVDQLTSYARFSKTFYRPSADVKDCATATLALPASPEFTRLTSRGIFRRWKNNFATTAVR
ncbi:hypothetical protein H3V53_10560 [Paraburkholderia bengalensis]|uniref:Uncharacterized protein n=1 Tax=Paraburkholderia bengalensis TaxID=2747562 RepID=A0ABU8IPY2_9BURK